MKSPTKDLCHQSLQVAARSGAINPSTWAGALCWLHDNITAHALDEAIAMNRAFGGFDAVVERLTQIQTEERNGANNGK